MKDLSKPQAELLRKAVAALPNFYKSPHTRTTGKLEDLGLIKFCGSAQDTAYGCLFHATDAGVKALESLL